MTGKVTQVVSQVPVPALSASCLVLPACLINRLRQEYASLYKSEKNTGCLGYSTAHLKGFFDLYLFLEQPCACDPQSWLVCG